VLLSRGVVLVVVCHSSHVYNMMMICCCGSRAKFERLDVQKEYDKRQATGKDNINLVVIGEAVLLSLSCL